MKQQARAAIKLDTVDLIPIAGKVMVRVYPERYIKTAGGLLLGDLESINEEWRRYLPSEHAVRCGTVVAVPNSKEVSTSAFNTTLNVEVGDEVWFDFHTGMYSPLLSYEDRWYYMMDYASLIVKKSGNNIEPLNGYLLGYSVDGEPVSFLSIKEQEKDHTRMVIQHAGEPVHFKMAYSDNAEVNAGDTVFVPKSVTMLEYDLHCYLDGSMYRFIHRKDVIAIL